MYFDNENITSYLGYKWDTKIINTRVSNKRKQYINKVITHTSYSFFV